MSKLGKKPIALPEGVKLTQADGHIIIEGPKGKLERDINPQIKVSVRDNLIVVERNSNLPTVKALHGLTRSLIANMVEGVTRGFKKELEIVGVGYRVQKAKDSEGLLLQVGFTHPVFVEPVEGIKLEVDGTNKIIVSGCNKELVGNIAAKIRAIKPPEPYKGKGIKYIEEEVRRKPGKAGKVAKK